MQHGVQTYGKVANQTVSQRELEASLLLKAASRLQAVHDGWERKRDELADALTPVVVPAAFTVCMSA